MNFGDFNLRHYKRMSRDLNARLRRIEAADGLPAALAALESQQRDWGFVQSDPHAILRWPLVDPADPSVRLNAQYNPARAKRPGAGAAPPAGMTGHGRRETLCQLCPKDVPALQHYRELGYELAGLAEEWIVWMNPYPLMPAHATLATREHQPQAWICAVPAQSRARLEWLLGDLLGVLARLPGFVGFHNGPGAGASQPHMHLQLFERPKGEVFPLEAAGELAARTKESSVTSLVADGYPVRAVQFRGTRDDVVRACGGWVEQWLTRNVRIAAALSANIIASAEYPGNDRFRVFLIPRSKLFERVPVLAGMPASLEILGELVLSSEAEKSLLDSGKLDYHAARHILASVDTPGLRPVVEAS